MGLLKPVISAHYLAAQGTEANKQTVVVNKNDVVQLVQKALPRAKVGVESGSELVPPLFCSVDQGCVC